MYVLDTNVVSEFRKLHAATANRGFATWAARIPSEAMFISSITAYELELGTQRVERRDQVQGRRLRQWLDGLALPGFDQRIIVVDQEIARRAAIFNVPDPAPLHDALIGATAAAHGMRIVTRNVVDFERFGVGVFNPWT